MLLRPDASSLTELIQTVLSFTGLDPSKAVAQCYDGSAAMSGVKTGVQARMRESIRRLSMFTVGHVN